MNADKVKAKREELDTIVVPSHPKGFEEVFLGQSRWPNLKIDCSRLVSVKFIAVYQTKPISAITHYAEIASFSRLEKAGRFDITFSGKPQKLVPVKFTAADVCAVQGPRYTNLNLVLEATNLTSAFPRFER